jgi:hypothetical protein
VQGGGTKRKNRTAATVETKKKITAMRSQRNGRNQPLLALEREDRDGDLAGALGFEGRGMGNGPIKVYIPPRV